MTEKQRKFVDGVLAGLEPPQAAKEAGYKGHDAARALLANGEVTAVIRLAKQGTDITRENVLKELGRIGFAGGTEKTSDRLRALEVLCKVLGLYDRGGGQTEEKVVIVEDLGKPGAGIPPAAAQPPPFDKGGLRLPRLAEPASQ